MYSVGLSTCSKTADEAFFRSICEAGIRHIEVSPAADGYRALDWQSLRRLADRFGVALWSFHLPFLPFETHDISAADKTVRRRSVEWDEDLLRRAAEAGVTRFVVHPSGEPIREKDRAERLECAKESLAKLAETAEKAGGAIAVEDLPRTCLGRDSGEILSLLSADSRLGVCFDTNHLLRETPEAFIRAVGDRIVTTHVSDYDFADEKHWLPGEGDINWQSLFAALRESGYGGVWLYELGYRASGSMRRPRDLTPADFVNNACEIFEGRPLTVLGRRT